MEKQNQKLNEMKINIYKWSINYKNRKDATEINRLSISHTTLTHRCTQIRTDC